MEMHTKGETMAAAALQAGGDFVLGNVRMSTHYSMMAWRRGKLLWTEEFDNMIMTQGANHILARVILGATRQAAGTAGYCDGRRVPKIRANSTAYIVGEVMQPPGGNAGEGYIYICTAAGTSAAGAPAFGTTPGGSTTDGTATFINAAQWFIGPVSNTAFSTFAIADTLASHGGWTEGTTYSETVRQLYVPGTLSGTNPVLCDNNSNQATFSINGACDVNGAFLTDDVNKNGTGGATVLYGGGTFSGGARTGLQNGDQLKVKVTTSCAAA